MCKAAGAGLAARARLPRQAGWARPLPNQLVLAVLADSQAPPRLRRRATNVKILTSKMKTPCFGKRKSVARWLGVPRPDLSGYLEQRLGHVPRAGRGLVGPRTRMRGAKLRNGRKHRQHRFTQHHTSNDYPRGRPWAVLSALWGRGGIAKP